MPPTSGLGSLMMMAVDRISSPPSRVNSHAPAKAKGSRSLREPIGLLTILTPLPLIEARSRDEAAALSERFAEQWQFVHCLGTRVDVWNLRLLLHPKGREAPTRHDEFTG